MNTRQKVLDWLIKSKQYHATHENKKTGEQVHVKTDKNGHYTVHSLSGKYKSTYHRRDEEHLFLNKYRSVKKS